MSKSNLIPISYFNPSEKVRISAYADIIIYEKEHGQLLLRAIRFGGYPEMVNAMSDVIYAGGQIEMRIDGKCLSMGGESKRFDRQMNHDGVYAEATLLAKDDEQDAENPDGTSEPEEQKSSNFSENTPQEKPGSLLRKCLIFCPQGDRERLFEELDRKTAVPMIPEFRDYVLDELRDRNILRQLTVVSIREKIDAWVLVCEKDDANIISVVEDGLHSGRIIIPGEIRNPDGFDNVENVTGYLNAFGVTVAKRIRSQFEPLFDPAKEPLSPEILAVNDYILEHAGYPLYDAQLAVAEALKRQLTHDKVGFIVAECGSGKTKIGSTAMAAVYGLRANQRRRGTQKTFNVILCPSHVANKWVREITETLPDTAGVVVRSIAELDRLYALYEKGDKNIYAVITKERARDGYMKRPAVLWNRRRDAFLCPTCMDTIEIPYSGDGSTLYEKVSQKYFQRETKKNHKCPKCGAVLWTAVNPGKNSDWVKIGGYGWIYKHRAWEHFEQTRNETVLERLQEIAKQPNENYPTVGAARRYPLSTYIKHKYRGRLDGLICDELHQYNNDSGQGDAMGEFFNTAKKVIGMTATLINGYSSGIFHLLFRTMPAKMIQDGKRYAKPGDFDAEYGVVQTSYDLEDGDYASNRRQVTKNRRTRQLPGVSPLVYSRFLLEKTAFLSLSDMGKNLPDYEEIPVAVDLDGEVKKEYDRVQNVLVNILKSNRRIAQKILSVYLNLLTIYPDQPYDQPPIRDPDSGHPLVEPASLGDFSTVGAKEEAVMEIVRRKISAREKVLIYTSWVRSDSQNKLLKLLTEDGIHAEIMNERIKPDVREEWVQKRLASGMQVLITNPSLVETGLDLNSFTTLIFYSMGYKLFTLRQASRRSWRINQTAPKVEVYMLYYKDTMQQKAMKLMASKLAVAGIIEGSFTEEGLAAMSDVQDMTSQMAKELMLGIRDNVEDIAGSFKKMAIINAGKKPQPEQSLPVLPTRRDGTAVNTPVEVHLLRRKTDPALVARFLALEEASTAKKTKKTTVSEGQLSIFDCVA